MAKEKASLGGYAPVLAREPQKGIGDVVSIPYEVYEQMLAYTYLSNGKRRKTEIGGMGYITESRKGWYRVDALYLPRQHVNSGQQIPDTDDLLELVDTLNLKNEELERHGRVPLKLKFYWHYHIDYAPDPSWIDTQTVENCDSDWRIHFIFNSLGDYTLSLDTYSPVRMTTRPRLVIEMPRPRQEKIEQYSAEAKEKAKPIALPKYNKAEPYSDDLFCGNLFGYYWPGQEEY